MIHESMDESRKFVAALAARLVDRGLDIVHPFVIDDRLDSLFRFPRFGRSSCLGVLIGNSRAIWAPFIAWLSAQGRMDDPLDTYVERCLAEAVGSRRCEVYFTQRRDYGTAAGRAAVPFQRLGDAIGFATLGPAHLGVHPRFGPWFAYRAVLAIDAPSIEPRSQAPRVEPCMSCDGPCRSPMQKALDLTTDPTTGRPEGAGVRGHWQIWVDVRDACPVGRAHRYGEAQIAYHYTKDPRALT